jgi:transcriptional regulator with XRE-family HTH domain
MIWTNQEIASLLTDYRQRSRYTQQEIAAQLGISRNYLSLIERGEATNVSLDVYRSICDVIGHPPNTPSIEISNQAVIVAASFQDLARLYARLPSDLKAIITSEFDR